MTRACAIRLRAYIRIYNHPVFVALGSDVAVALRNRVPVDPVGAGFEVIALRTRFVLVALIIPPLARAQAIAQPPDWRNTSERRFLSAGFLRHWRAYGWIQALAIRRSALYFFLAQIYHFMTVYKLSTRRFAAQQPRVAPALAPPVEGLAGLCDAASRVGTVVIGGSDCAPPNNPTRHKLASRSGRQADSGALLGDEFAKAARNAIRFRRSPE